MNQTLTCELAAERCCARKDCRAPYALIVEDHPLVADSLAACVHDGAAELEVETAESLRAALRILALRPTPLLIVSNQALTDTQGNEAAKHLRGAAPRSPLLIVAALDDPVLRDETVRLGAIGYLPRNTPVQILRSEIRAILALRPARRCVPKRRVDPLSRLLTPKQFAVLEELAAGRSNREIAGRMKVSDDTVASHMKEIFRRLAVRNRTEAVVRFLQKHAPGE